LASRSFSGFAAACSAALPAATRHGKPQLCWAGVVLILLCYAVLTADYKAFDHPMCMHTGVVAAAEEVDAC
jgi:hypothetical protein